MPQLLQEVNHFNTIHVVNLVLNQSIRNVPLSGFIALLRSKNSHLPKVLTLLHYWLIPSLLGKSGGDGLVKKISKNGYLSLGRASFAYSS